jgi:hypothetical protein
MESGAVAAGHLSQYFGRLDGWRHKNSINLEQCEAAKRKALLQFYATNPDETVEISDHLSPSQQFTNKRLMQGTNSNESRPHSSEASCSQQKGVVMMPYAFEFLDMSMLLQVNLVSRQLQRRVKESQTWVTLRYHRLEHNHDHAVRIFASNQRLLFSGDCFGVIKVWDMLEDFKYMRDMHCRKNPSPRTSTINDPKVGSSSSDDAREDNASGDDAKSGSTGTVGGATTEETGSSMPGSNSGVKTDGSKTNSSHARSSKASSEDSSLKESDQKGGSSDTFSAEVSGGSSGCFVSRTDVIREGSTRQFQKLLRTYNDADWDSVKAHRSEITGRLIPDSHNDVGITSCLQGW